MMRRRRLYSKEATALELIWITPPCNTQGAFLMSNQTPVSPQTNGCLQQPTSDEWNEDDGRVLLSREARKALVAQKNVLPLWPRHHIYLFVLEGDGRRFSSLFRETLKRLPLGVRRCLFRHLRDARPLTIGLLVSPYIELADYPLQGGRKTLAETGRLGHRLRFRSKYVDLMPDDVVLDLIVHELAHVLQDAWGIRCVREYADGRADYVDRDGDRFGGNYEIEESADELMTGWGFDAESIDRWGKTAGITKVVKVDDPEKLGRMLHRQQNRIGR
jgi:hypothetical protein